MMANFHFLIQRSYPLSSAVALALLVGCIDNPNSVGTEANASGGAAGQSASNNSSVGSSASTSTATVSSTAAGNTAAGGATGAGGAAPTGGSSTANTTSTTGTGGANTSTTASDVVIATATEQILHSELGHDATPNVADTQYQSFIGAANDLGLELFRRKAAAEKNLVFSPASLHVALSMAYAGAKNNTAAQMNQVLGDPFGDANYHRAVNKLITDLRSRNLAASSAERPQSVELSFVDTWFLQRDYPIKRTYLDLLATEYDAGVRLADFMGDLDGAYQLINQFASDSTNGKIENLMRPGDMTALTRAVLVNALYFKATWKDPFAAASTTNTEFTTASSEAITTPTMHATQQFAYQAGSNYQAIRLPYVGDALSMLVVLPAAGEFANVRAGFNHVWIGNVNASLVEERVMLSLPKFRFLWGTEEFNTELQSLGMIDAFRAGIADFTGISAGEQNQGLYILKVLQKAFIGVDEAGTEAAAVSAVVMNVKAMVEASMEVNRPFLFSILDKSGAVLFVGQVMDPR